MPSVIYRKFVKGYTEKQWGVPAHMLSARLARRLEVRYDGDFRLSRSKYQGLPINGYTNWVESMLRNIPTYLNTDFLDERSFRHRRHLFFTGPLDAFWGYTYGHLRYRGQRRMHYFFPGRSEYQPTIQVNYPMPGDGPYIRTIEWTHLIPKPERANFGGTLVTYETPINAATTDSFEYPFPDGENDSLASLYRKNAAQIKGVTLCGRLGEYRYLDMDQAIARAILISDRILRAS